MTLYNGCIRCLIVFKLYNVNRSLKCQTLMYHGKCVIHLSVYSNFHKYLHIFEGVPINRIPLPELWVTCAAAFLITLPAFSVSLTNVLFSNYTDFWLLAKVSITFSCSVQWYDRSLHLIKKKWLHLRLLNRECVGCFKLNMPAKSVCVWDYKSASSFAEL